MPQRVFVAYDFVIKGTLPGTLQQAKKDAPAIEYTVEYAGSPDAPRQGDLWERAVKGPIRDCDRVVAFTDKPNANVGFEIGYAIGLGKRTALLYSTSDRPKWLKTGATKGLLTERIDNAEELLAAIQSPAQNWLRSVNLPIPGDKVLFLCPVGNENIRLKQAITDPRWAPPPAAGWNLEKLPELLAKVGLVVWVIAAHSEGDAQRDGDANAALSAIAGYALALADEAKSMMLRVLRPAHARTVADVENLRETQEFTSQDDLERQLKAIEAEWQRLHPLPGDRAQDADAAPAAPPEPPMLAPEVAGPPADFVPNLPTPDWLFRAERFIGRGGDLNDIRIDLNSRWQRARGEAALSDRRVIWAYGYGGMGKTWLLHRIREEAETKIGARVVIVTWDSANWRAPLAAPPGTPTELFRPIGYRLAQAYTSAIAQPYWQAIRDVAEAGELHGNLWQEFSRQLAAATAPAEVDRPLGGDMRLRHLLESAGYWATESAARQRRLQALHENPRQYQRVFESWCQLVHHEVDTRPAVLNPEQHLANGLRESLRAAASQQPLVLLLDTCEVLRAERLWWLRKLLLPLCLDDTLPFVLLIGSRLGPDTGEPTNSGDGWRDQLGDDRLRRLDFSTDDRRFNRLDLEEAVGQLTPPLPPEQIAEVVALLERVTHGIPLAVRELLDQHNRGQYNLLAELHELQPHAPSDRLPNQEIIAAVTKLVVDRLLLHLTKTDCLPEDADNLPAIVALALLQQVDKPLLQTLWKLPTAEAVDDHLTDLGARYALLGSGDLHDTVRMYLRAHWRLNPANRPRDVFANTLAALDSAVAARDADRPAADVPAPGSQEIIDEQTQRLNLRAWHNGAAVVPALAATLAVALAYGRRPDKLYALLRELWGPVDGDASPWNPRTNTPSTLPELAGWLSRQVGKGDAWPAEARHCVGLLEARAGAQAKSVLAPTTALELLDKLEAARRFFGETLPQPTDAADAYFWIALVLAPYRSKTTEWIKQTELAYQQSIAFDPTNAIAHNNLGYFYANATPVRFEQAEAALLEAQRLDPATAAIHQNLGELYATATPVRFEQAEAAFLEAQRLDPSNAAIHKNLGDLYASATPVRFEQAETAYLEAQRLDPANATIPHWLGFLYATATPVRFEQAEAAYLEAQRLDPSNANIHKNLGILYANATLVHFEQAEAAFLEAQRLDPADAAIPHWLGAFYAKATPVHFEQAEAAFLEAQRLAPKNAGPLVGLAWLYAGAERLSTAKAYWQQAAALDVEIDTAKRFGAWWHLLYEPDLTQAARFATEAQALAPVHPNTSLTVLAVRLWEAGWAEVEAELAAWLRTYSLAILNWEMVLALSRRIQEQGALAAWAAHLRAAATDYPQWEPLAEATTAIVQHSGLEACTTPEARRYYEGLLPQAP